MDEEQIKNIARESAGVVGSVEGIAGAVSDACAAVVSALQAGNKVLTAGNGGSAAEALHMSEELIGRFRGDRRPLPAVCLAGDPTAITCICNDYGYEAVFSRQVEGLGASGDVLVLFSTSGNSENLVRALDEAKKRQMTVVSLLGKGGGAMAGKSDHELLIDCDVTERIQEAHQLILHIILDAVESAFAD